MPSLTFRLAAPLGGDLFSGGATAAAALHNGDDLMSFFVISDSVAARRRMPVELVDVLDGITAETGETGGQPEISVNGGAFGSTSAVLVATASGGYYVELTTGEIGTLGRVTVRYKSANTAEFKRTWSVIGFNLFAVAPDTNIVSSLGSALVSPTTPGVPKVEVVGTVDANITKASGTTLAVPTTAGIPKVEVVGTVDANLTKVLGTTAATPTVAGIPKVEVSSIPADVITATAVSGAAVIKIAAGIWDALGEGSETYGDLMRGIVSALVGEVTSFLTGTLVFKSLSGAKTRWTVTTNNTGRIDLEIGDLTD